MPANCWLVVCAGAAACLGAEAYKDRMDCLRSDRPGTPGVPTDAALDGRAGGADCVPPKKSRPSNDSPGLFCFGGAAGALTGGGRAETAGSVVTGRGGCDGSSPNRSMFSVLRLTG